MSVDITKVRVGWLVENGVPIFTLCGPNAEEAIDFYTTKTKDGETVLSGKKTPRPTLTIRRLLNRQQPHIRIIPHNHGS